jgi:hypothetical protein
MRIAAVGAGGVVGGFSIPTPANSFATAAFNLYGNGTVG